MELAYTFEDNAVCAKKNLRTLSRSPNLRSQTCAEAAVRAVKDAQRRSALSCNDNISDGGVRVKILMNKQELKHMVASMGWGKTGNGHQKAGFPSLDQLRHLLKRRQMKRADHLGEGHHNVKWRPELQSIPEEL